MFCPRCHSEYRPGFTRCADCDVELVESLTEQKPGSRPAARRPPGPQVDFCGFFTLEEAREARDRLRREGIRSEIAIRESPGSENLTLPPEEYWLRFDAREFQTASAILGFDEQKGTPEELALETRPCPDCGQGVAAAESFCPQCGARLKEGG